MLDGMRGGTLDLIQGLIQGRTQDQMPVASLDNF